MKKIFLVGIFLILVSLGIFSSINIYAGGPEQMKGVWLWNSTVIGMGKDGVTSVIADLKNYGFTDIFLLIKGNSGTVCYPSKIALTITSGSGEILQNLIAEAHKNNIKVHGWFVINGDLAWAAKHPEDVMVHLKNGPTTDKISPLAPAYQSYIKALVQELIDSYEIDGIHLDYIRYGHAVYSFDKYVLEEAQKRKIDIEKVKSILNQALYDPKDSSIVVKAYQSGDSNIVAWEKLRRDVIVNFAQNIKQVVKNAKRPLAYSAALMPEGAYDPIFADIYYGQNYKDAALLYDFVIPMAYWKDFGKQPGWVGTTVVKRAVAMVEKFPVMAGLQAYEVDGNKQIEEAIAAAEANGAKGVVYFRYGSFVFASMEVKNDAKGKTTIAFELVNRTGSNIDLVVINFDGTGIIPQKVRGAAAKVNNNTVSLEGDQLLTPGMMFKFSIETTKDSAAIVSSTLPLINLSRKQKGIPVCAMLK